MLKKFVMRSGAVHVLAQRLKDKNPLLKQFPVKDYYSVAEVVLYLEVPPSTIRKHILQEIIVPAPKEVVRHKHLCFTPDEVLKYLDFIEKERSQKEKEITLTEAAKFLRLTPFELKMMTEKGRIPSKKGDHLCLFPRNPKKAKADLSRKTSQSNT